MTSLDDDFIRKLLEEEKANASSGSGRGGSRGPRTDPTAIREVNVWFKLPHHICHPDCEHRQENPAGPHQGCWNTECVDPRDKETDRGIWVVVKVKDKWICRYCFLAEYLK